MLILILLAAFAPHTFFAATAPSPTKTDENMASVCLSLACNVLSSPQNSYSTLQQFFASHKIMDEGSQAPITAELFAKAIAHFQSTREENSSQPFQVLYSVTRYLQDHSTDLNLSLLIHFVMKRINPRSSVSEKLTILHESCQNAILTLAILRSQLASPQNPPLPLHNTTFSLNPLNLTSTAHFTPQEDESVQLFQKIIQPQSHENTHKRKAYSRKKKTSTRIIRPKSTASPALTDPSQILTCIQSIIFNPHSMSHECKKFIHKFSHFHEKDMSKLLATLRGAYKNNHDIIAWINALDEALFYIQRPKNPVHPDFVVMVKGKILPICTKAADPSASEPNVDLLEWIQSSYQIADLLQTIQYPNVFPSMSLTYRPLASMHELAQTLLSATITQFRCSTLNELCSAIHRHWLPHTPYAQPEATNIEQQLLSQVFQTILDITAHPNGCCSFIRKLFKAVRIQDSSPENIHITIEDLDPTRTSREYTQSIDPHTLLAKFIVAIHNTCVPINLQLFEATYHLLRSKHSKSQEHPSLEVTMEHFNTALNTAIQIQCAKADINSSPVSQDQLTLLRQIFSSTTKSREAWSFLPQIEYNLESCHLSHKEDNSYGSFQKPIARAKAPKIHFQLKSLKELCQTLNHPPSCCSMHHNLSRPFGGIKTACVNVALSAINYPMSYYSSLNLLNLIQSQQDPTPPRLLTDPIDACSFIERAVSPTPSDILHLKKLLEILKTLSDQSMSIVKLFIDKHSQPSLSTIVDGTFVAQAYSQLQAAHPHAANKILFTLESQGPDHAVAASSSLLSKLHTKETPPLNPEDFLVAQDITTPTQNSLVEKSQEPIHSLRLLESSPSLDDLNILPQHIVEETVAQFLESTPTPELHTTIGSNQGVNAAAESEQPFSLEAYLNQLTEDQSTPTPELHTTIGANQGVNAAAESEQPLSLEAYLNQLTEDQSTPTPESDTTIGANQGVDAHSVNYLGSDQQFSLNRYLQQLLEHPNSPTPESDTTIGANQGVDAHSVNYLGSDQQFSLNRYLQQLLEHPNSPTPESDTTIGANQSVDAAAELKQLLTLENYLDQWIENPRTPTPGLHPTIETGQGISESYAHSAGTALSEQPNSLEQFLDHLTEDQSTPTPELHTTMETDQGGSESYAHSAGTALSKQFLDPTPSNVGCSAWASTETPAFHESSLHTYCEQRSRKRKASSLEDAPILKKTHAEHWTDVSLWTSENTLSET